MARASRTPATFAQATASTSETISVSSVRKATSGPLLPGTGEEASRRSVVSRFSVGYSRASVWPITSISAAACAIRTFGVSRPPISSQAAARSVNAAIPRVVIVPAIPIGTHTSLARIPVPRNPADATPTIVNGAPLSVSVRPTMEVSRLNRRVQKPWLKTAMGLAPGCWLSLTSNSRPATGATPSAVK